MTYRPLLTEPHDPDYTEAELTAAREHLAASHRERAERDMARIEKEARDIHPDSLLMRLAWTSGKQRACLIFLAERADMLQRRLDAARPAIERDQRAAYEGLRACELREAEAMAEEA